MPIIIKSSLVLYLFPLIISLSYGFQYRFQGTALEDYFRFWTIPWALALGLLAWHVLRQNKGGQSSVLPEWPGVLLSVSTLALTCYFYLSEVMSPGIWLIIMASVVVGIAWLARYNGKLALYFLVLAGLAVNLYLLAFVPHDSGANMLAIIESAGNDLLSGHNPYTLIYEGVAKEPFGYLPGRWLPYLPLIALGLDPGLLNVLLLIMVVWMFERHMGLDEEKRASLLGATLYPLLLSPPISLMIVHGHVWPYWAMLIVTMLFLQRNYYLSAAILYGVLLATRQPALWLAPPLAAYLVAHLGVAKTIRYASISLAVFLLLVLPFALTSKGDFWQVTYLGLGGFHTIQPHLSAIGWFGLLGIENLLRPIQFMVLLGAMYWIYRNRASCPEFLMVTGLAYLLCVFFNVYAVRYIYIPGLLLLIMGYVHQLNHGAKRGY